MVTLYYFQENGTSRRPFLLLRISFPGRPIFIQFVPGGVVGLAGQFVRQYVVDVERVLVLVLWTRQQVPHLFDESRLEAGDHGGAPDDDEVPRKGTIQCNGIREEKSSQPECQG